MQVSYSIPHLLRYLISSSIKGVILVKLLKKMFLIDYVLKGTTVQCTSPTNALEWEKLWHLKHDFLERPYYSPDFALSQFHLFLSVNKISRKYFGSNEEVMDILQTF